MSTLRQSTRSDQINAGVVGLDGLGISSSSSSDSRELRQRPWMGRHRCRHIAGTL